MAAKKPKALRVPPESSSAPALMAAEGRRDTDFPVVGIGCSAGGLEALEKLFSHVPNQSGIGFIAVQHLDPNHESGLPALLQRHTGMPVREVTDGMSLSVDAVYVIPPGKDMAVLHGKFQLLDPIAPRGLRLPIDFFLRSLAADRKEAAIGVILSGMGSDGVLGLRAIKEKGGLTVVQDPLSAQADSMPVSAIQTGLADIIASPESMPARIGDFLAHRGRYVDVSSEQLPEAHNAVDKIIVLLRERTGNDFSQYKTNTLHRRIERRMAVHQIGSIDQYVRHLRGNATEIDLLFRELLIGVTNFFRDPEVWDLLRDTALPALLARHPQGGALRAWVPGCSTGEEAYSLAIVFKEVLQRVKPVAHFSLQIYATDLDADAIERARKGLYPHNIGADVAPERLDRFFVPDESGGYRIGKDVREMVVFATQNLTSDPPFTKLDILCCRNLLIYFGAGLQKKLLPVFHYVLNHEGMLLLGSAESIGNFDNLFTPINSKARLFQRCDSPQRLNDLSFPGRLAMATSDQGKVTSVDSNDDLGKLTDKLIQQQFSPAAVLVNAEGDILYISGRTGKYLEPAAGKTNMNLHAMARDGLAEALVGVIFRALKDPSQPILLKGVGIGGGDKGKQYVDVTVQALDKPDTLRGRVLVVFRDVPPKPARRGSAKGVVSGDLEAARQELQQAREALQTTHEEMQTTVEELKSSNEELQSTNEELQSTNEELTTSKEELQSLNEELQTVNAELQSKVEDLTWVRNDMTNLLNSTEIATIFIDNELKLRRFTSHATKLFKLIPGDVGRPLTHVVTDLDYPRLLEDASEVLRTLVFQEKQVTTHDGRWYRVRLMPYRTHDNVIDGVVITFIDMTEVKLLEAELRRN